MNALDNAPGTCWVFGDDINTDFLAPGKYMKFGIETIARHCLEDIAPAFAASVRPGDIVIGGKNFGTGSSREQAVEVLRHLGVRCVIAQSFAGLFYRNGFNLGLPLLIGPKSAASPAWGIADQAQAQLDLAQATLKVPRQGPQQALELRCSPIPEHLLTLVNDGGLVPHLRKRLASRPHPTPEETA
ncbi:3-isopropylmalate dehydratase [Pantoea sp. 18069]|uniref:LeuD/DmdB family oxidoreductase small subunit n=1 Tax=Pantoea sp. 18069 TaxID=2681415 RepID=UPI00135C68CA|nr:3-isopropylmalate dehydratase [Pantoea sp. 18069]